MAITISGSGSITGLSSGAGISASALSGQVPDANAPSGSVLQVVQATKTDTFSTNSTSFTDITGLSVSITPSNANNKILVSFQITCGIYGDIAHGYVNLVRNSTNIFSADSAGSRTPATKVFNFSQQDGTMHTHAAEYLDSPSSTSAITYKLQLKSSNTSQVHINRSGRDNDGSGYDGRAVSSITVMEIAA